MDNFNLKNFLIENKLTSNSKVNEETSFDIEDIDQAFKQISQEEDFNLNENVAFDIVRWLTAVIGTFLVAGWSYGMWIAWGLPEVKRTIEMYKLDRNSTKEEVEAAAQEILDSLSPQKKAYLKKVMDAMRTKSTKPERAYNVQKAQDAITRYKNG